MVTDLVTQRYLAFKAVIPGGERAGAGYLRAGS